MGKEHRHAVFVGQRRDWAGEALGSGVQVGKEAWQRWPKSGDFALRVLGCPGGFHLGCVETERCVLAALTLLDD